MRKLFIVLGVLLALGVNGYSQSLYPGEQTAGVGLGVPSAMNTTKKNPAISVSGFYEYGFTEKLGIGHIGGGAIVSLAGGNDYRHFLIGPRAAYHFDMTDITGDKAWDVVDVYAGIMSGARFRHEEYYDPFLDRTIDYNDTDLITDIFAGIRYSFADNIGVYAEAGYGVSYLTVGLSFRF
ncbi:hypothetical protein [Plebeiibacterium marinum]|uniref:Outer membrane protein beta-barrel domain-containing protein n=1 Tax=Plebeiibacterium marinum TaxID=2992111 RepID=A0AAE3MH89_9BACT|nr:hypothetical protein [Plebeiobacterium marinum]MCW3807554.1 hypothetical protein [Plebeiobacterium marinum]